MWVCLFFAPKYETGFCYNRNFILSASTTWNFLPRLLTYTRIDSLKASIKYKIIDDLQKTKWLHNISEYCQYYTSCIIPISN